MKRKRNWEEVFSGRLLYRTIHLHDVETIAKYSFIVHESINYLDLSLREFSSLKEKEKNQIKGIISSFHPVYLKKFVSTVESCRKTLVFERRCLYALNLDLPNGREEKFLSLNTYDRTHYFLESQTHCFNELVVAESIYENSFRRFIEEALEQNGGDMNFVRRQIALVKRMVKYSKFEYYSIDIRILKCMFPTCNDSEIVKEFLSMIDFDLWFLKRLKQNVLEYLLQHAYYSRYDLKLNDREGTLVNECFFDSRFEYVELLLKYQNAPFYYDYGTRTFHRSWMRVTRTVSEYYEENRDFHIEELAIPFERGLMSKRRFFLWLQVLHAYPARNQSSFDRHSVTWTLGLLWRSLPDAFFTLGELTSAYQGVPGIIDTLTKVHEYYVKVIDKDFVVSEPRSLQQYCRVTIRKSLCYNLQLPFGIEKLKLPLKPNLPCEIKAFIKLEK